jgi:pimeloyl-ACP methyl ester carboxylesterase
MNATAGRSGLIRTVAAARIAGLFSEALARRSVARLWFTPWRMPVGDRTRRRRSEWLRPTLALTIDTRHGPLRGFSAGEGPTVLLVHGWSDEAAGLGAFIAPLVAEGYRVVGIDLPAHGASPGQQTNGIELAEALSDVARELGDVHAIVAHSLGAWVAVYAMSTGLDVRALVLLAPLVSVERAVRRFEEMFRLPRKARRALEGELERRFGPHVWDRLAVDSLVGDWEAAALIVHDRDDPQIDIADGERLASRWPGARFVTTSGLAHQRVLRDDGVVKEVTAFLAASRRATIG